MNNKIYIFLFLNLLVFNVVHSTPVSKLDTSNDQAWLKSFKQTQENFIEVEVQGKINNFRLSTGSSHQDCIYSTDRYSIDLSKLEGQDFTKLFYPEMIHYSLCGASIICEKLTGVNGTQICKDITSISKLSDVVDIKVGEDDIDLQINIYSPTKKTSTILNFYCSSYSYEPDVERKGSNFVISHYSPHACPTPLITREKDKNKFFSYDSKGQNEKNIATFELYENSTNVISFNDNAHFIILPIKPIINNVQMNEEKDKIILNGLFLKRIKNHYSIRINNGNLLNLANVRSLVTFNSTTMVVNRTLDNGNEVVREVAVYLANIPSDSYLFVNGTSWISVGSPEPIPTSIKGKNSSYLGSFLSYLNPFSYI
ncbi:hypothetical protein RB653_001947 [Dictyostelium firmibasis]|uniref:Uncharacterized protein n=1 Tax=Dictyostelium firmibasis TaxID=79012 RepID=A0AAN7YYE2_9MYCE